MIPRYRAWDGGSLCRMYSPEEVWVCDGGIWVIDEDSWDGELILNNDLNLMQSTGLTDKNGKEIFEGDILTTRKRTGVVNKHLTLGFYINDARGDNWWFGSDVDLAEFEEFTRDVTEKIEILGNIYTNQELAEVSS